MSRNLRFDISSHVLEKFLCIVTATSTSAKRRQLIIPNNAGPRWYYSLTDWASRAHTFADTAALTWCSRKVFWFTAWSWNYPRVLKAVRKPHAFYCHHLKILPFIFPYIFFLSCWNVHMAKEKKKNNSLKWKTSQNYMWYFKVMKWKQNNKTPLVSMVTCRKNKWRRQGKHTDIF